MAGTDLKRVALPARLARRARDAHKGSAGTVLVVAGSRGMLGAAILACRGALRGGAGLVRCALPAELMAPLTVAVPGAMTLDRDAARGELAAGATAIVCGPGLPPETARPFVTALLAAGPTARTPLVLDAGALDPSLQHPLGAHVILTPHPGEAARLLGSSPAAVQGDREGAARTLASRYGAVVVLKGAGTIVCDGARIFVNETGNPGLATGGTGDVLAGLLGALLAQGMAPFDAATCGVHVHGAAGDLVASRLSEPGLCAEDLPLAIAEVLGR